MNCEPGHRQSWIFVYFLVLIATLLNAFQRNGGGVRLNRSAKYHNVKQRFEQAYGLATVLIVLYITT